MKDLYCESTALLDSARKYLRLFSRDVSKQRVSSACSSCNTVTIWTVFPVILNHIWPAVRLQPYVPARCNMVNADEIARLCYERFNQLPRRGKPEPGREWTLLAAVLRVTRCANSDTGWTAEWMDGLSVSVILISLFVHHTVTFTLS